MIDARLIKDTPEFVRKKILQKDPSFPIETLIALSRQVAQLTKEIDALRQQRNERAKALSAGAISSEDREQARLITERIKQAEADSAAIQEAYADLQLRVPNILSDEVPLGTVAENKEVIRWGEIPQFMYKPQSHVEIATKLGWIDLETAATMSGAQFALYKGDGARLLYALAWYMLIHARRYGYEMVIPPLLINEKSLIGSSNLPRFADQVYKIQDEDLYLTPTAEVNLTNMHRDSILTKSELPYQYVTWSSCFRREAGGYGAQERGLIRLHQFEKVELYAVCTPDQAAKEHERMLTAAQDLLKNLGLPYRLVLLAAQDTSFASAKTYDLEVWLPSLNAYKEVASISHCTDFQARRAGIRYREQEGDKVAGYAHTLNGSCLAFSRLFVALLEVYQQPDGSVSIPEALKQHWLP